MTNIEYQSKDEEEKLFKSTLKKLTKYLYNNNCLSTSVFNKMNDYINNLDVYNKVKFKCAILRYNAYCYILIQSYIAGINNEYDVCLYYKG